MCGICGYVGPGGLDRLQPMMRALVHRGPDEHGSWIGDGVALGMRRLSIIDAATGQQPVFNETGDIVVVFNGEIYNFIELRRELIADGHIFRTDHSDTEVIVHLYEQFGDAFLHKLNGMFAIALWDRRARRLLLARDRIGIKPLFYAVQGECIVFGSEPKALLAHPDVSRQPDLIALHHYFSYKNTPAPRTAFAGIRQLRAGECLVFADGSENIRRWWRIGYRDDGDLDGREAAESIRALLEDSVRLQMRSDVPVGAYLSGGVDSSTVVALMSRLGASNVKTFTLIYDDGFPHKDADRTFANNVARMYGTDHYEHVVRFEDVPQHLDDILTAFDEPFSGVISTYFITQSIARHVKVALSGDGADELFASYLPHRLAQPLAYAAANPSALAAGANVDVSMLAPFESDTTRLRSILDRGDEAARRMGQYLADEATKREVYSSAMREAVGDASTEALTRDLYAGCSSRDALNRSLCVDFETLLPDQVLAFVDRLSMAHSVEVRPPFLDHRLVEFVANIPGRLKIKGGQVKYILKDAVRDLLPVGLVDRPKEGFVMPLNDWLAEKLKGYVLDKLSAKRLASHGLLEPAAVAEILSRYYAGEKQLASRIWNFVSFQMWWERYQE
ncbi:asparagine synthase (glutamine-hydrolyzing) [Bradyrhizobium sp. WD16]|uniref:asparagine synthase (glutamine-hydrolyzing) n=1 Tax=Bradyrhizobium sp. WD16 TaxID=1521768 RepID=UPI0020A5B172|nr:asparagine synthase (glutamine-hydrolyzing) [Bradyrhizobium sp. WD16]UTD29095.1 asparagine synthase (glutamine-hydrolyzing) [Bradyrhizobium sp. WD16]